MSLSEIVAEIKHEAKEKLREQEILQVITKITSPKFAEQAADTLDAKKHEYSFKVYLILLERLERLISGGMPNCQALEATQTGMPVETLLYIWRHQTRKDENV